MLQQLIPDSISNVIDHGIDYVSTLEPYCSKTVVLVPSFLTNWDLDGVEKLVMTLFMGYPLGLIMAVLPFGTLKHIYAFLSGLMLLQWTTGPWWIYSIVSTLITYGIMVACVVAMEGGQLKKLNHRQQQQRQYYIYMKYAVCIFLLTAVSILHCLKMYRDTDHSLNGEFAIYVQMTATQKLYKLVYNIYDGYILATMNDDQKDGNTNNNNNENDHNTNNNIQKDRQIAMKLKQFAIKDGKIPNLLQYLGYVYCFSTLYITPTFEFSIYRNACDGTLFDVPTKVISNDDDNNDKDEDGKTTTTTTSTKVIMVRKKPPSNILPTLKPLLQSIGLLFIHAYIYQYYGYMKVMDPTVLGGRSFAYRFYYEYMAGIPYRFDFYLPWKISEGSTNLWYGGFDGYDEITGQAKGWTNSWGVDIYSLEFSANAQLWTKRWNIKTSEWLKRYVYYRCNGSLPFTYVISALWHGFYPLYYLMAIGMTTMQYCERLGRKKLTPLFWYDGAPKWKQYGYAAATVFTYHVLSLYFAYPFAFRTLDNAFLFWKTHYYYGHLAFVGYLLIVPRLPDADPKKYPMTDTTPTTMTTTTTKQTTLTTTSEKPKAE